MVSITYVMDNLYVRVTFFTHSTSLSVTRRRYCPSTSACTVSRSTTRRLTLSSCATCSARALSSTKDTISRLHHLSIYFNDTEVCVCGFGEILNTLYFHKILLKLLAIFWQYSSLSYFPAHNFFWLRSYIYYDLQ